MKTSIHSELSVKIFFIKADDSIKFLQMPEDLTVLEGHQLVKLTCRSNDLHAQIKWLKVGNLKQFAIFFHISLK